VQIRRQVSPLLTFALFLGAIWIFRQSPWIRESQGLSPRPNATPSELSDRVATMAPMIPPGFRGVEPTNRRQNPAFADSASKAPLVSEASTLQLANPKIAGKVQLQPERREKIARLVSSLNSRTEHLMQEAIQEWKKQGGVSNRHIPDFQSASSPHRREIEKLTQQTEKQVARLLAEDELARWKTFSSSASNGSSTRLNMGVVE
jgi:hypothetical protein